jgi:hypothetical protein
VAIVSQVGFRIAAIGEGLRRIDDLGPSRVGSWAGFDSHHPLKSLYRAGDREPSVSLTLMAIRDRKFLRVCANGDAAKVFREAQTARRTLKKCRGLMTYQTTMLSLGNVDMDHRSYI